MGKLISVILAAFLLIGAGSTPITNCTADEETFDEDPWGWYSYFCADDGNNATCTYTGQYSTISGFGFAIPYQAIITGVEVIVESSRTTWCNVAKGATSLVYVTPDGWVTNASKTASYNYATPTVVIYGTSGDLWGLKWSPNGFNSNLFRVELTCSVAGTWSCTEGHGGEYWVDYVAARVNYRIPDDPVLYHQLRFGETMK
jgi:hypothetical protein